MNMQKLGCSKREILKKNTTALKIAILEMTARGLSHMKLFRRSLPLGRLKSEQSRRFFACVKAFALGFVFSLAKVCDGVYPFGNAYLLSERENCSLVLAGNLVASLFYREYSLIYFALSLITYIARVCFSNGDLNESLATRVILSLCTSTFMSTLRLCFSFCADSVVASLLHMALLPLGVYLFSRGKNRSLEQCDLSLLFPWMLLLLAVSRVVWYGSSVAFICASVLTMLFARLYDSLWGGIAGLMFGVASAVSPLYPSVLGLCGLVDGLSARKSKAILPCLHCVFSPIAILLHARHIEARQMIIDSIIAVFLCGCIVGFVQDKKQTCIARSAVENGRAVEKELDGLSDAFSSLSQVFYRMSERLKSPSCDDVRRRVTKECYLFCRECSHCEKCKHKDSIAKSDEIYKALSCGKLSKAYLPKGFAGGCIALEKLLYRINSAYKELFYEYYKDNKAEILASQYSSVARLIRYTSKSCAERSKKSPSLATKAERALNELRIFPSDVIATTGREAMIEARGVRVESISLSARELACHVGKRVGLLLEEPEFAMNGSNANIILRRKKKISLEYAKACHAKSTESVSGDSVSFFESERGYFYALISDGMGSGREAALTSRLTSVFIEKLLSTGANKGATLEMLNNLLLSKNDECFATVDLLEIDLLEARASFIKAGAAPAFVIRSAKLYRISSETPPAGIIDAFCAENTSFSLRQGDVILLLSDGIIESFDDTPWLAQILGFHINGDISRLAEGILEKARSLNIHDDDMSVVAVRVK